MPEYVVSPDGREGAAGTAADPFPTIQDGVDVLTPGDVLVVRGGSYPENVHIADKHGTLEAPIHIRCHPGETVFVDGFEPADITGKRAAFRTVGNDEWLLASDTDPQAHTDEYVSKCRFPSGESTGVRHGAFVDREPYTRLITYSCLADLRAENQRFGRLPLDDETPPFPGHAVLRRDEDGNLVVDPVMRDGVVIAEAYKRPWTYLGPGLCQDPEGRIHIRLSHTANATPGIADYDEATDPRTMRLAISQYAPPPLRISGSEFVQVDGLHVRFGGNLAVRIETSSHVVLDHVDVRAGSGGIFFGGNTGVHLRHCTVDGGRPTWLFRSDIKDGYLACGDDGSVIQNDLAAGTPPHPNTRSVRITGAAAPLRGVDPARREAERLRGGRGRPDPDRVGQAQLVEPGGRPRRASSRTRSGRTSRRSSKSVTVTIPTARAGGRGIGPDGSRLGVAAHLVQALPAAGGGDLQVPGAVAAQLGRQAATGRVAGVAVGVG